MLSREIIAFGAFDFVPHYYTLSTETALTPTFNVLLSVVVLLIIDVT